MKRNVRWNRIGPAVFVLGAGVWLASPFVGEVRSADETLPKVEDPKGCPPGYFCGKVIGFNGGCRSRNCCEEGETSCFETHSPVPSASIVKAGEGTCYSTEETKKDPWCTVVDCGDTLCGQGCTIDETGETIEKDRPKEGESCNEAAE